MKRVVLMLLFACASTVNAQQKLLVAGDGSPIRTKAQWRTHRQELIEQFSANMYGHSPAKPAGLSFRVVESDPKALNGLATRKQVRISLSAEGPSFEALLYIPNARRKPAPAILGLNFSGNHAIHTDPGIHLTTSYVESSRSNPCTVDHRATDACRGTNASQWPVEQLLQRGYALVTAYREDIASDVRTTGFQTGIHPFFPDYQNRPDNFGTIAAWAWALSRIQDYLETDKDIDSRRVAVFGFSRLGKAALWAGATDERFAAVISNESGAGGAKLFHRGRGENIRRLCTVFPHWFCRNFHQYMDQDTVLPFDQHQVIALIAPRPVYVASAVEDTNSDPEGEFQSALLAGEAYAFLGKKGLPVSERPPLDQSVQAQIGYHIRSGGHNVTAFDWEQYLRFLDRHFK
ncbi:alpha/beta hydrolase family protein [Siphonobacter aquaeclarae]|uniref:4-O-methyl-glucuronoyl methylesterase-like domain-containing protein n=1 Tax=Siphonobacter aquaeclarae TaxID=563176 RepID=A0A1G9HY94_9BACT|nr:acetylxylan esterase [Siphonobacter aquaeclarae]SDL17941.1 hypothetical protein SAMN04488090_0260 [Siphonobacter aquaeclarae]